MTRPRSEDDAGPAPELLAAYADGELDGTGDRRALKEQVEAWLARHPEAAAEVASLRRLREAWQAATPADPGEDAWDALRARLHAATDRPQPRPGGRRRLAWGVGGAAAAVAAVWLALALLPSGSSPPAGPGTRANGTRTSPGEAEPFPVASADEVEIVYVRGADTRTLVVGAPPVEGPLVLAGPGDVTLESVQPADPDNMVPDVLLDGPTPMIWARLQGERE